jgi:hypothetical protein
VTNSDFTCYLFTSALQPASDDFSRNSRLVNFSQHGFNTNMNKVPVPYCECKEPTDSLLQYCKLASHFLLTEGFTISLLSLTTVFKSQIGERMNGDILAFFLRYKLCRDREVVPQLFI